MGHEKYLVPRASFSQREQLREALFTCFDELEQHGLEFVETGYDESDVSRVTRFSDDPETSHIELWEDYVGKVRYLRVESPAPGGLDTLTRVVESLIPTESHEDLCARVESVSDPSLLYRVAYSAPEEPSPPTVTIVVESMKSPEPEVVVAAAEAAGIIGWREFVQPLGLLRRESDPGVVRQAAARALEVIGL